MPKPAPESKSTPHTFETALAQLQQIVDEMDSNSIALQDLITRYEEGIKLAKICEDRLKDAEKRIEIITRNAAGQLEAAEFEADAKAPAAAPRPDVSLF